MRKTIRTSPLPKYLFLSAVVVSILSYMLQDIAHSRPETQPATSVVSGFSGESAIGVLSEILSDNEPHPTGSVANKKVKGRILNWLARNNIEASVQTAWGCSNTWGRCSPVENIIAIVPGEPGNPYITLMSHYDSTPASIGAGDNGAGVATILEVARLMKNEQLVNPVMLLITDAEENGLLGAEAFFTQHPLRAEVGVVLNLEASTTTGRSFLFRTSIANQQLVRTYGAQASHPGGTSLYNEIFKRMAGDTDFTVPKRLGYAGMDFVFIGEGAHHHTRNDNLQNLDVRSVQHHGDNLYPIVRSLATQPLQIENDSEVVFLNLFGMWLTWSTESNFWLLLIGLTLLSAAAWRSVSDWRQALASTALPLVLFLTITLITGAVFLLVHFINGTTPFWPANLIPYRLILFGVPAAISLFLALRFNKEIAQAESLIGIWIFWGLLGLGFSIWLPAAAYLFLLPLCVAGFALFVGSFLEGDAKEYLYLLSIPVVVALHVHPVLLVEQSLGYWFVAVAFIFLALFASAILPFLKGRFVQASSRVMVVVSLIAVGGAIIVPGFSSFRPQTAIYQIVENTDQDKAWLQFLSLNSVPDFITELQAFDDEAVVFPWTDATESSLTAITPAGLAPPTLRVTRDERSESDRWVTLELNSNRNARDLGIVISAEARAATYVIGGEEYAFEPMEWGTWIGQHVLELRGINGRAIQLRVHFETNGDVRVHLFDITPNIASEFDHLIEARDPLVVQVHQGDRTFAITTVSF